MKILDDGILSHLGDVKFPNDIPTCDRCFQSYFDGLCRCEESPDPARFQEAADWIAAGVSPEEMAASGVILEDMGQKIIPVGIHFDIIEDKVLMAAAEDCADLAHAMRQVSRPVK